MNKQIVIIGASGHGKVVADIAKLNGYTTIAFLDDNTKLTCCGAYPVVGTSMDVGRLLGHDFIVAIGNNAIRKKVQERLEQSGAHVTTLIHPAAVVADDVQIGAGSVVMAGAVINAAAELGKGCIINTCASVDHDCLLAEFVHVSVGAHLAGTVEIGAQTWIGAGAVVSNNLKIVENCMIGAGAVVVRPLEEEGTYVGVPAKRL